MINTINKKVVVMLQTVLHTIASYSWYTIRILLLLIALYPNASSSMGFPDLSNLSPEEMEALERELEQFAQNIDQYVSTLSPEQQAEFHQAVEEATRMMESMTPEELEQFFNEALAQELANAGQEMPQPVTQPTRPAPEQAPVVEAKPRITSTEQDAALAMVDSIIQRTDAFLVKMNNVPDLSIRVKRWIASNKVQSLTDATWESIKNTIETFKQSLYHLKEVDPKTNQYRFISSFTKNNELYTALSTLESALSTNEPRIIVSSFGIEMLNTQSKNAIVAILNAYNTALSTTPTQLIAIFGEFAPEAQKLKEEEAKRIEQARAEAAKPRSVKPPRVAGSREPESFGGAYKPSEYDRSSYGGYGDYGYPSYGQQYGMPTAPATEKEPSKDTKSSGGGSGGKMKKKKKKDGDKKEEEKKKEEELKTRKGGKKPEEQKQDEQGKPGTQPEAKPGAKPSQQIPSKKPSTVCPVNAESAQGMIHMIKNNLDHSIKLWQDSPKTKDLLAEVSAKTPYDMTLALVTFPGVERHVKRINELVANYLAAYEHSQEAQRTLINVFNAYPLFKTITSQVASVYEHYTAGTLDAPIGKLYAYLALEPTESEDEITNALQDLKKTIPHPASLLTIFKELDAIERQLTVTQIEPTQEEQETEKGQEESQLAGTENKPEIESAQQAEEEFVRGLSPEMQKLWQEAEQEALQETEEYWQEKAAPVPSRSE